MGEKRRSTLSLSEQYLKGRCGRTTILFREVVNQYTLIFVLVAEGYVTETQLADVERAVKSYRNEVEQYIAEQDMENKNPLQFKLQTIKKMLN